MDILSDDDDEPMPARKRNDKKASNQFDLLSEDEDDDGTTMDITDSESSFDMETDEPAPDKHPKKVIFRTNTD
jgi:hypothetical protein